MALSTGIRPRTSVDRDGAIAMHSLQQSGTHQEHDNADTMTTPMQNRGCFAFWGGMVAHLVELARCLRSAQAGWRLSPFLAADSGVSAKIALRFDEM